MTDVTYVVVDTIGWISSALVVAAYALNMFKRLASDSLAYFLMNIIGSGGLILNTIYHHAIPSAVVNIIWIILAFFALLNKRRTISNDSFSS